MSTMISGSKDYKIYLITFICFIFSFLAYKANACEVVTPISENICRGQFYTFAGENIYDEGVYSDTLKTEEDCDSIIILTLSVLEKQETILHEQICSGQNFTIGDQSFSSEGIHIVTLQNQFGCDSIIHLHLLIATPHEIFIEETICQGHSFSIGGQNFETEGEHTVVLQNQFGCDSIVHLSLQVNPTVVQQNKVSICEGETYQVGTHIYQTSGVYTDTLSSHLNCDSIIITQLEVAPFKRSNIQVAICQGETFMVGTNIYSTPGLYRDTLKTYLNCDSIITLNLQVYPSYNDSITVDICQGASYFFGDRNYSETGIYSYTFNTQNLCDSIVTLFLNVHPLSFYQQNFTICEGETITVGANVYATEGTFTDTLKNEHQCDSIITTTIQLIPTQRVQLKPQICQGQTFAVGNHLYSSSGTYIDTLKSSANCDSIITTILTVNTILSTTVNKVLCEGDHLDWNGRIIDEAGIYIDTLISSSGCDSIVTLQVQILAPSLQEIHRSVCAGSTYTVGQSIYDVTGIYTDTLSNQAGCDSIVILHLTVKDPIIRNIHATICEGYAYRIGDSTYWNTGIYTQILMASDGCDSTVILNLTVEKASKITLSPTICQGTYFQVGNKKYTDSGTYVDTLINQFFCDSIVTTILTVQPNTSEQITRTICQGSSITIGNNTYNQPGLYRDTLKSIYGCDSIIILRLQVQNQITFQQQINLCEGQSYTINGHIYNENGTYLDTLVSSGGCDSIVTSVLTFRPKHELNIAQDICEGDTLRFGSHIITTAGTYTHTFSSSYQCDSIVTINVDVLRKDFRIDERNSCEGQTIRIINVNYTSDTTFFVYLKNQLGCDSTIEFRLKFHPVYNLVLEKSVCKGKTFNNIHIEKDTTLQFHLKTVAGCDSNVVVHVKALDQLITERNISLCSGSNHFGLIVTKDTIFKRILTSAQGCDSIVVDTIKILENPEMTTTQDTTVNPGTSLTLFASGAQSYQWSTGSTAPTIVVRPQISTVYTVVGTHSNGCTTTVDITIHVNSCNITASNYFTPNGDGIHDQWKLKGAECLSDFTLKIVNRWGDIVFETSDIHKSWDGQYKGQAAPEGVYFFILEGISAQDQKVIQENGYIHLNR